MGMNRAMKAGVGTFACGDECVQVGAVAAVNAVGDVYNGAGNIIAGLRSSDGSEIYGTIRVFKGMLHEESSPDLNLTDIKTMAVAEALQRLTNVQRSENTDDSSRDESVTADDKDDIVKAMMQSYEQEQTAARAQDAPAEETPAQETFEEAVHETADPVVAVSTAAVPSAEEKPSVEDAYLAMDDAEGVTETIQQEELRTFNEVDSTTGESVQEVPPEEVQEESSADDDEFVLTEEDRNDMGYDIPFNTTISCLITNAVLTKSQANKLASILHDAYARAIKPVHGTMDGDTIFVMSTCTQEVNFDAFAALAVDVMQYAIIDAASSAEGAYGLPAARDIIRK